MLLIKNYIAVHLKIKRNYFTKPINSYWTSRTIILSIIIIIMTTASDAVHLQSISLYLHATNISYYVYQVPEVSQKPLKLPRLFQIGLSGVSSLGQLFPVLHNLGLLLFDEVFTCWLIFNQLFGFFLQKLYSTIAKL